MNRRIDALCACAAIVLGCAALGPEALAASKPQEAIDGVWVVRPEYYVGARLSPQPELTPAAEAQRKRRAEASARGYVRSVGNMLCQGGGGPSLFMIRSPFEVFSGFGRVTFIFETETFNQPRTVYIEEKSQPADPFPSANGHSIGHWEGETLVVDTVGFNDRGALLGGIARSEKAHIVERFTVSQGGKVLTDEVRMEDPEVDRLLDPDRRGTDPALKIAKPESK